MAVCRPVPVSPAFGAGLSGGPSGSACKAEGASHGLGNHVETFVFAIGTRGAKTFNAGVNNAWVNLFHDVIAQSEVFNCPRGVIFHDDVRMS